MDNTEIIKLRILDYPLTGTIKTIIEIEVKPLNNNSYVEIDNL